VNTRCFRVAEGCMRAFGPPHAYYFRCPEAGLANGTRTYGFTYGPRSTGQLALALRGWLRRVHGFRVVASFSTAVSDACSRTRSRNKRSCSTGCVGWRRASREMSVPQISNDRPAPSSPAPDHTATCGRPKSCQSGSRLRPAAGSDDHAHVEGRAYRHASKSQAPTGS